MLKDPSPSDHERKGPPNPPGRLRRTLARIGAGLGLTLVFVAATATGATIHLNTPGARRVVQKVTNDALDGILLGKIVIDEIDYISIVHGLDVRSAVVLDPNGHKVIRASGIRARVSALSIAKSVLFGDEIHITIPFVRIEHADVLLETGADEIPTIAEAFTPTPEKEEPRKRKEPEGPSAPLFLELSRVELGHAWVHGEFAPGQMLDTDVKRLVGSVRSTPDLTSVDIDQTGLIERRFLPAATSGTANYHLRIGPGTAPPPPPATEPAPDPDPAKVVMRMWADFAGQVGEVEVLGRFLMEDDRMEATADVPKATPAALAKLVPGLPLRGPVSASARVEGVLPRLELAATATLENVESTPASVEVVGGMDISNALRLRADVTAKNVDPRLFGEDLPAATVNAQAHAELELGDELHLVAFAQTEPTVIEGQLVPALDAHAVVAGDLIGGTAMVHEEGMPLDASFDVLPDSSVRFAVTTDVASIRAVPRIGAPVDGSARVAIQGMVKDGELDATVRASASEVRAPGDVTLAHADIQGRVHGPFEALEVNASVQGKDLFASGYAFDTMTVQASGPVTAPWVSASLVKGGGDLVRVSAMVDAEGGGARGVKAHIEKDGKVLNASVARVGAAGGGIVVDRLRVEGDGVEGIEGSLRIQGNDVTGKLRGDGIDLEQVSTYAGLPLRLRGIAGVDIDLARARKGKGHLGHVNVALENGEAAVVSGVSAMLSMRFEENDTVRTDGFVRLVMKPEADAQGRPVSCCGGEVAVVRFSEGEATVRGGLLDPATWTKLNGSIKIAAEDWDLNCLARLAPPGVLPISDVKGKLTARFKVEHVEGQDLASVRDLFIRTRGLEVAGPQAFGAEKPDWESRLIDVQVKGAFDAESGKTEAQLTLYDGELLGDLTASMDLDVPALLDPKRRGATLQKTPIAAHLSIPRRAITSFESLPSAKGSMPPLEGEVRIDAFLDGTMEKPNVVVRTLGWGIAHSDALAASPEASDYRLPVDLDALATYDSEKGTLEAHVTKGRMEILTATAEVTARLSDLTGGAPANPKKPQKPLWTGSFRATLNEVPLGEVPVLADNNVGGHVSGTIKLLGLGEKPSLAIDLDLPDLMVGQDMYFAQGDVSLHIDPRADAAGSTATAKVNLVGQDGGSFGATASAGILWQDGVVPGLDDKGAANLTVAAKHFRLATLQPAVAGVLSKLDGYLDGELRLAFDRAGEGGKGTLEGDLAVTKGIVYVPQMGQEFQDAHVRIIATPTGVIRLDDIGAKGMTGSVNGWALARLDGLNLKDAAGELKIPDGQELPLALEGVPLGTMSGTVKFAVQKREKELVANIDVPDIHLELPASIGRSVQPLDENPDVVLSQPLAPEEEVRPADGIKIVVNVDVDRATIKGPMIDAALRTAEKAPLRVEITDKTRIGGDVVVTRGRFDVMGKEFELEQGLVHLRGDEEMNPYVNATVRWDAPDGSRIFITYDGDLDPITEEKIRFRSDPTRTKQEIIATLLLGSEYEHGTLAGGPAQANKGPERSTGNAAGGIAAGFISDQFSGLLADSGISTSLGTTDEGALKTGLTYQRGSARAQVTYEGEGAAIGRARGQRAGLMGEGRTEVSIDWRFHRNWLVRGSVGMDPTKEQNSESGGIDLLWQHRY